MKKLALATAAILAVSATPALAQDYDDDNMLSPLSGFYAGAIGGFQNGEAETDGDDFDIDGAEYGAFVGFKADTLLDNTVNRFGLGLNGAIEAHYIWSDADGSEGGIDAEKDNEWGISFRPGLSILDDVSPFGLNPYGIIGYRNAEFEVDGDSEDFSGFELGLGTEVLAYENFGVRFDYAYTWYEEKSDIDPSEHTFRAGVAYHF